MRKAIPMRSSLLPSGQVLSLLGVSAFFLCAVTQAQSGQKRGTANSVQRTSQSRQVVLLPSKRTAAPPAQGEVQKTKIGDITFSKAQKFEVLPEAGTAHWVGPNTEIEVPDKASSSVLLVHADDILASRVGKTQFGLITLNGDVRYRLIQKTDTGERILEGTAGHVEVRRAARRIDFTGGVHTKLTDAARFSGPATLRTGALTLDMDSKPSRYTLEGGAGGNDIQFTPLQSVPEKVGEKPAAAAPLGAVHLYGFRSGDLQFGKAVHVQGAATTCEFSSPDAKTAWKLQGEQFEGEFVPDKSDLQRATVTDNVRFHVMQPSADKKSKTVADGTASQASFVRTQSGQEMVAHGPLKIDFTDPQHFEEPMTLTAQQSSVLTVKKDGNSLSYALNDPQQTQKIHIVPKPFDVSDSKPATPPGKK